MSKKVVIMELLAEWVNRLYARKSVWKDFRCLAP